MEAYSNLPTHQPSGNQYRIIATRYPAIDFFERHVPADLLGPLWELEARTNPRLQEETGDLRRVAVEDRVSGPGASIVMAAFTHIGWPSRFTDGRYGVYYAGRTRETAIRETVHHRELIARNAGLTETEFSMRVWSGSVQRALHDIRLGHDTLHDAAPDPRDHPQAQAFGRALRARGAWGILYRSVRHAGGECIAAFRPPAISLPVQGAHLVYVWDGDRVTHVYEKSEPIVLFDSE
jgi:hypothetical protein